MEKFTHETLRQLAAIEDGPCVSMFIPARGMGANTRIDVTRMKNLLRTAERDLAEGGFAAQSDRVLEPVRNLLADHEFWKDSEHGLAVFASPAMHRVFRVPVPLEESVTVARRFDLLPLLCLGIEDCSFQLLALSKNHVRLFRGSRQQFEEIHLEPSLASLNEFLRFSEFHNEPQMHTGAMPSTGGRSKGGVVFHGSGSTADPTKRYLHDYFRAIDHVVLHEPKAAEGPLVLAGVEYLHALYRAASRHPHIVSGGIDGNTERLGMHELHALGWKHVASIAAARKLAALEQFRALAGTGRTSAQVEEIVTAAATGQVQALFATAANGHDVMGHVHAKLTGDAALAEIVGAVIATGGTAFAVGSNELPQDARIAALMRYSI